jgi:transcriptional regulator with XRE-family HTH domain
MVKYYHCIAKNRTLDVRFEVFLTLQPEFFLMKKYNTLSELLIDYRNEHLLSQIEFAALVDVDVRTVSRWEKNETLIKPEKEKDFVERLFIPHQVIHNLNSDNPISVYYDMNSRTYSLNAMMATASSADWFTQDLPKEDDRIRFLSKDTDVEFVNDIQEMSNNPKPINPNLIKVAADILPELNLILHDQSDFYAGHITVLPLKFSAYKKIRDRRMKEGSLSLRDLTSTFKKEPLVFYYYSLYADSMPAAYYLMNRLLSYFKEKQFKNYLFAGITFRKNKVELLRQMGLKVIWEEGQGAGTENGYTFLEGDFDMFLFGKMT